MTYEAKIEPRRFYVNFPWRTFISGPEGPVLAEKIHLTWFFARLRYRKLKRRVTVLNRESA